MVFRGIFGVGKEVYDHLRVFRTVLNPPSPSPAASRILLSWKTAEEGTGKGSDQGSESRSSSQTFPRNPGGFPGEAGEREEPG